ncbi:MAG: hypothetical protein R6V83_00540 [Candidatus Thorarchaeota archaeon]
MSVSEQTDIRGILSYLTTSERDRSAVDTLNINKERFLELYRTDGTIASLTHRVILNPKVAHCFCFVMSRVDELWEEPEIRQTVAEALRQGDSLLIDALCAIRGFLGIPEIQEAIADNIATCSSIIFQLHVAAGYGLHKHPSIKRATLGRLDHLIARAEENWHDASLIVSIPYLAEQDAIKQAILAAKPDIVNRIRNEKHLTDEILLLRHLDWLRNDKDVVRAIRDRILDDSIHIWNHLAEVLHDNQMLRKHPELVEALNGCRENERRKLMLGGYSVVG